MGNLNRTKGTNVAPSKAYTNSVPGQHSIYPGGQHTLAFYTKCVMPQGQLRVWYGLAACESLPGCNRTLIGLHGLAVANG